ncbi:MAG: PIN domain-containing protein [Candidatus Bathyarchaeia archaeon]
MPKAVYDTRFFVEHFYNADAGVKRRIAEEIKKTKNRYISSIVIHEVYVLSLKKEGRETAKLRRDFIEKAFRVVDVDSELASSSAELRHKYGISLADSLIASTSKLIGAPCVTDDPHLTAVKDIKTRWL